MKHVLWSWRVALLVLLLFPDGALAQVNTQPVDSIIRAGESGARQGQMILESHRIAAETQRIRLENELLREQLELMRSGRSAEAPPSDGEMVRARVRLQRIYPDIHLYWKEIDEMFGHFYGRTSLDQRIEAFYALAKCVRTLRQAQDAKEQAPPKP